MENVTVNLSSVFLSETHSGANCTKISIPKRTFIYNLEAVLSTDIYGNEYDSKITNVPSADDVRLEMIDYEYGNPNPNFYLVSFSPVFKDDVLGATCDQLLAETYHIGNILERQVISYDILKNLHNVYYNSYDGFRTILRTTKVIDTSIVSEDLPELRMERFVPASAEVISKDYLVEVLYPDGKILNTIITIRMW